MDTKEIARRVTQVRKQIRQAQMDALIVIGVENVRYLTGFRGHDSWALVLPRSVVLVTDSRYTAQAQGDGGGCKIVQRKGGLGKEVDRILSEVKGLSQIAVEDSCSVGLLKSLKKDLHLSVKPVKGVVENVRIVKTADEVKMIRRAGKIAFDAMTWALEQLKVGMTERQLTALYEFKLADYKAKIGFETIVCFGPNGSRNHHQPGERKLRKNDTILCDFGANYEGYISDITRSFAFGKATEKFRNVYKTVALSQKAAIDAIRDGVKRIDADQAARKQIEAAGFPVYGHGTGHGLGLQVHESPYMSPNDKKGTFKSGYVMTVEPGIYLPGQFGIRLEDDVLVTATGAEILTADKRYDVDPDNVPVLR
jgi:Xaa-Pro aminopeptidase